MSTKRKPGEAKPFWESKTFQAAAVLVLGAVVDAVLSGASDRTVVAAGAGALMAFLRTQTTGPVGRRQ